tara:strand:- start:233 stop:457 length:225 start_codon:yes stop_codon:yes gene_type:complete
MSNSKPKEPQKLFSFTLTEEQAHAILLASFNYQGELKKLKDSGNLGVAWRIVWDYWMSGHKRMYDQFSNQSNKQ